MVFTDVRQSTSFFNSTDNHSSAGNPGTPWRSSQHEVYNHNSDLKHGKPGISVPGAFKPLMIAMSHMLSILPSEAYGHAMHESTCYLLMYYMLYSMVYSIVRIANMGTSCGAIGI